MTLVALLTACQSDIDTRTVPNLLVSTTELELRDSNVSGVIESIAEAASARGGLVIGEERRGSDSGSITVSVPAPELDAVVDEISATVGEVVSRRVVTEDLRERHAATQADIAGLEQTQLRLQEQLDAEFQQQEAAALRRELAATESAIARQKSQLAILEDSGLSSHVVVRISSLAKTITLTPALDRQVVDGRSLAFSMSFVSPEGIEEFEYFWEFGDGNRTPMLTVTESTGRNRERATGVVYHTYEYEQGSAHTVRFAIRGEGSAGTVAAEDSMLVTVLPRPAILLTMPDRIVTRAGRPFSFVADMRWPEPGTVLDYEIDFGDGRMPQGGLLRGGEQQLRIRYNYEVERRDPYLASVRISAPAQSDLPSVTAQAWVFVDSGSLPSTVSGHIWEAILGLTHGWSRIEIAVVGALLAMLVALSILLPIRYFRRR